MTQQPNCQLRGQQKYIEKTAKNKKNKTKIHNQKLIIIIIIYKCISETDHSSSAISRK
jgi:hypothetical protein